jgi:hypothetical protein
MPHHLSLRPQLIESHAKSYKAIEANILWYDFGANHLCFY